jgi:hypothetical protein
MYVDYDKNFTFTNSIASTSNRLRADCFKPKFGMPKSILCKNNSKPLYTDMYFFSTRSFFVLKSMFPHSIYIHHKNTQNGCYMYGQMVKLKSKEHWIFATTYSRWFRVTFKNRWWFRRKNRYIHLYVHSKYCEKRLLASSCICLSVLRIRMYMKFDIWVILHNRFKKLIFIKIRQEERVLHMNVYDIYDHISLISA